MKTTVSIIITYIHEFILCLSGWCKYAMLNILFPTWDLTNSHKNIARSILAYYICPLHETTPRVRFYMNRREYVTNGILPLSISLSLSLSLSLRILYYNVMFPLLQAFEHLIALELVQPMENSGGSRVQKEYRLMSLMIHPSQVLTALQKYPNCPTEISQWASCSTAVWHNIHFITCYNGLSFHNTERVTMEKVCLSSYHVFSHMLTNTKLSEG